MISRDSNHSEIFEIFAEQMGPDFLKQAAEYLLPENILESAGSKELDVSLADVMATASAGKLYGVVKDTGEKLVGDAHPGGGTKLDLGGNDKELSKSETIVEQHKKIEDIARKMPKGKLAAFVGKISKLADAMDEAGFAEEATDLDTLMTSIAAVTDDTDLNPGDWITTYKNPAKKELDMDDVDAEISRAYPQGPEMEMGEPHVQHESGTKHEFPPANVHVQKRNQSRDAQLNDKALALTNQHLQDAGHQAVYSKDMPAALKQMGIQYGNWNELFQQLAEKGPAWAEAQRAANSAPQNLAGPTQAQRPYHSPEA